MPKTLALMAVQRQTAASRSARPPRRVQHGVFDCEPTTTLTKPPNKSAHTPSFNASFGHVGFEGDVGEGVVGVGDGVVGVGDGVVGVPLEGVGGGLVGVPLEGVGGGLVGVPLEGVGDGFVGVPLEGVGDGFDGVLWQLPHFLGGGGGHGTEVELTRVKKRRLKDYKVEMQGKLANSFWISPYYYGIT
ncbi:hypothetical protein LIER_22613 [Lithospermum erythrorhizon]|uniref:Uncharacterized protein n=1 Tax=Lithospermum erythrorhizon TaxID=34254 RepID=A0AAV3QXX7_LITER